MYYTYNVSKFLLIAEEISMVGLKEVNVGPMY